jgi:lipoprotein-releasing system ATP-binding protein
MIITKGITKKFNQLEVLKGIDVEISKGKITTIIGASGAGKSTLLQIIGTLDVPTAGTVFIDGQDVTSLKDNELSEYRNKNIGFVFQFHHLLPEFTALENVMLPGMIKGTKRSELETRAKGLLTFLKLEDRMTHKPSELSGGEQQRVAIARALINEPTIILADEPSGNLDSNTANELHQLFIDIKNEFNTTFVIVTHNKELSGLADEVIEMKDGNIYRRY